MYMNPERISLPSLVQTKISVDSGITTGVQSNEYKVTLLAGKRYYIALYQLSHNRKNVLRLGFNVISGSGSLLSENPITNSHLVYDIPRNCSVIRTYLENAPDDEYVIRVHPKCNAVNVYCYNMASIDQKTSALEFITLTRGAECNYAKYHKSRLIDYTTCSGKEDSDPEQTKNYWGQTWFKRIRFSPSNLLVARNDFTFTYTLKGGNPRKFGSGGDCYSESKVDCRKGEFKINLNGTDMRLTGNVSWVAKGYPLDSHRITQYTNEKNQIISGHCGGSCVECQPAGGHIMLLPDMCLAGVKSTTASMSGKKNTLSRPETRPKRSPWWSWFW